MYAQGGVITTAYSILDHKFLYIFTYGRYALASPKNKTLGTIMVNDDDDDK